MSADTALRERARLCEEALQGAKEKEIVIGEAKGISFMIEKMRKSGMTEEQIREILNK